MKIRRYIWNLYKNIKQKEDSEYKNGNSELYEYEIDRKAYAIYSNDNEIRYKSTSGGTFTEIAKKIIKEGGVVVGAIYDDSFMVKHKIAQNYDELELLRQSKYVQSSKGDIYSEVKKELLNGKTVFFVGSPCEVAGLKCFLVKEYPNLYTADFICRGANSPYVYKRFLDSLEKKYKSKVKRVWFKNKKYSWLRFSTKVDFENGKVYHKDRFHDPYIRGYIETSLYTRSSCNNCRFKRNNRFSDLSFADFWGVNRYFPNIDIKRGVSLVITNNTKGEELIKQLYNECTIYPADYLNVANNNSSYNTSAVKDKNSELFYKRLEIMDFDHAIRPLLSNTIKGDFERFIYALKIQVRKFLKRIIVAIGYRE